MKKLYPTLTAIALCIGISSHMEAQTTHEVVVENTMFTPSSLVIEEGDIVRWTNIGGFHSVEGTTDVFPDNPASFGNSPGGAGWEYEFTFEEAGSYFYRCGVHTKTMFGLITVEEALSVPNIDANGNFSVYPNPAVQTLNWKWEDGPESGNHIMRVFDVTGKLLKEIQLSSQTTIDVSSYNNGMYFYSISEGNTRLLSGNFVVMKN